MSAVRDAYDVVVVGASLVFEKENRPFSPHITIGRVKNDDAFLEDFEAIVSDIGLPDLAVPVDRNLRARAGVVTLPPSEAEWRLGNHGVRCYLWISDARFTRSLKGVGAAGLPVRRG